MEAGANNFIMAPYCWIARFTLGNVLPVARDLPISHIYGIKISAAALVAVYAPCCYSRLLPYPCFSTFEVSKHILFDQIQMCLAHCEIRLRDDNGIIGI